MINISGLNKFIAASRDPFSEGFQEVPKKMKISEPTPVNEPVKWVLTAVMSEGEADTLLFKKENGGDKYAVTLKKAGKISLAWVDEKVEIKIGEVKILWVMGESKPEETLPKELIESIKSGDTGKDTAEKVPEAPPADGTPAEEMGGIPDDMLKQIPPEQLRNFRRGTRRR